MSALATVTWNPAIAGATAVLTPGTELCRADDVRRLYMGTSDGERENGRGSADG